MQQINWGIIGCGDVTEVKSGPAFSKVNNSSLVAVMRRDAAKAKDYAQRHHVPQWYDDAAQLINDPAINAIYIATPPASHEAYALAALQAGKAVYVEKPMTIDATAARRMQQAVHATGGKLSVAHYRRAQPLFKKIKALLNEDTIGSVRFIRLRLSKRSLTKEELQLPKTAWRVDASIAGGGLFHDLAPHQLDILYHFFGDAAKVCGVSGNQAGIYSADDIVAGSILFNSGIAFQGTWCFNVGDGEEQDSCEIVGSRGSIQFSFFDQNPVTVTADGKIALYQFDPLQHVQQPMIEEVVNYFIGQGDNPCSIDEGVKVMELLDQFTLK